MSTPSGKEEMGKVLTQQSFRVPASGKNNRVVQMNLPLVSFGFLVLLYGGLLCRLRPNSILGYRFGWTLRDAEVWKKTHRLGGFILIIGGSATFFLGISGLSWGLLVLYVTFLTDMAVPFTYSYLLWRRQNKKRCSS